jgi:ribosomal protein S6
MAVKKTAVTEVEASEAEAISRIYEVGYHIVPTFKEEDLEGIIGAIRSVIEKVGGAFIAEGAPALTRLAYPVAVKSRGKSEDFDRAYFGWIKFEASVGTVAQLEAALKRDPAILRYIVFRTVREETRARVKLATIRDVKRTDVLKPVLTKPEVAE